jgi:hypothetical protein
VDAIFTIFTDTLYMWVIGYISAIMVGRFIKTDLYIFVVTYRLENLNKTNSPTMYLCGLLQLRVCATGETAMSQTD